MKAIIASDLHGSLSSLHFLLEKAREINPEHLILLGDLVYHGPRNPLPNNYDTLSVLNDIKALNELPCNITAIRGNCDAEVDLGLLPFRVAEDAWIDLDNLHIYASHGHRIPEVPPVPGLKEGTVILRGHTHVPRGETLEGLHFWNPGSLSLPKGNFPRSYGIYEDGVFRVLDLNDNEILRHEPKAR